MISKEQSGMVLAEENLSTWRNTWHGIEPRPQWSETSTNCPQTIDWSL